MGMLSYNCRTIWYRVIHCDILWTWSLVLISVLYWAVLYCTYCILWCTVMQCTVLSSYYIVISWPYCAISVLVLSGMMSSSLIHSSMAWYTVVYCGKLCCGVETADAMFYFVHCPHSMFHSNSNVNLFMYYTVLYWSEESCTVMYSVTRTVHVCVHM